MPSNWTIWDFFKNHFSTISTETKGILSYSFPDPYIYKMFQDSFQKKFDLKVIVGSSLTPEWIEDNLTSLSLFGNSESFFISNADEIPKEGLEYFLESPPDLSDRLLVFIFFKESPAKKKISDCPGQHFAVEACKFWEVDKYFKFLCDYYQVRLSFDAKQFFLEMVEQDSGGFHIGLNILKINFPNAQELSLEQVRAILEPNRLDQFNLASTISKKEFAKFYEKLLFLRPDFDSLRTLFAFLQGHLIKLADTSVIEKKARLSKYDQEIVSSSKLWKIQELKTIVHEFAEYEIKAKAKNPSLYHDLMLKCVHYLK
jgi:hypothetical protein